VASDVQYTTFDMLILGEVVYTLLAQDRQDARARIERQLGKRRPELVTQWRATGREVRKR
jgi:hypothetical protein